MKDRRYRTELRLVTVPVIWRAKVPEKRLLPATRKMTDERTRSRRAREAAAKFMAALFAGVPHMFTPPEFQGLPAPGNLIVLRRFIPLERREGNGPDAAGEGSW